MTHRRVLRPQYNDKNAPQLCGAFFMVDISDNTLNRLKAYLSRFWQYYQTSVNLQKAIDFAQ